MARNRDISYYTKNDIDCGSVVWMGTDEYNEMKRTIREAARKARCSQEVQDAFIAQVNRLIENNAQMRKYVEAYTAQMKREKDRLQEATERNFQRLDERTDELEAILVESNSKIDQLEKQIEQEHERRNKNIRVAHEYLDEAVNAYNELASNPYTIKFFSADIKKLEYMFSQIGGHTSEDTISGLAIQILGEVEKYQFLTMREKTNFEHYYIMALSELEKLKATLKLYRNNLFFDDEKKNKVDVDFWSGNRFSSIEESCSYMENHLERDKLGENYLVQDVKEDIESINKWLEAATKMVEDIFKISDISEYMEAYAEQAAEVLATSYYYQLVRMGFEYDDPRGLYLVQMRNIATDTLLELCFIRNESGISYNYRINLNSYIDKNMMDDFLHSFSSQIEGATLNDQRDIDHIDNEMHFDTDKELVLPEEVKRRYKLTAASI